MSLELWLPENRAGVVVHTENGMLAGGG